ncbi:hypothetical protein GCM10007863_30890 [Dyella mobilis]|nr:hypothetical protein GCM10007863_30890 [Dyella mobilis]
MQATSTATKAKMPGDTRIIRHDLLMRRGNAKATLPPKIGDDSANKVATPMSDSSPCTGATLNLTAKTNKSSATNHAKVDTANAR